MIITPFVLEWVLKEWVLGQSQRLLKTERWKVQIDFDLAKRIDLRAANKKAIENLALAGGFDSFWDDTAHIFHDDGDGITFYEKRFGMV
jgi:DNA polymerase III alpha subunit